MLNQSFLIDDISSIEVLDNQVILGFSNGSKCYIYRDYYDIQDPNSLDHHWINE